MKRSRQTASSTSGGFTLLELIVVIGIFAIFAAMAYGGLDSVLRTRVRVEEGLGRTEDYDRAYLRMRGDFQNAASRSVRSGEGITLPSFLYDTYAHRVEFTRGGWQNLLNLPRATLERVSYLLDDGETDPKRSGKITARRAFDDKRLIRRSWYVLDRAPQTEAVDVVLLDHVQSLSWRFLDDSRTWQESWGNGGSSSLTDASTNAAAPSPKAVEMKIKTKDWGELKFLFALGAEGGNQVAKLLTTAPVLPTDPKNPPPTPPPPPPPNRQQEQ